MSTETKPAYSPGLAGVIAGETEICWVDPAAGLMYRGYDIHEMAEKASFEEVAYLLLNGELPTTKQREEFSQSIASERPLPKEVLEMMRLLPKNTHPMDMLRTGVSMLAPFDPELNDHSHDANIRKAIRLIAKTTTLIADGYRIQHGENPLPERPDLTMAGNLFYKLSGEVPPSWKIRMMDTIFILYADHEFNASTFAARVTASTLADMYAAVTSACGTLKGPLHGGANEESMKMLDDIRTPERAEGWMMDALAKKAKIMGFGHRVYKSGRLAGADHARDRRELGKRVGKEAMGADLRKTGGNDGSRETSLRQRRSLRRAGFHHAGIRSRLEHADLRRLARRRLVRARRRAAGSQPAHPPAFALHGTRGATLQSGLGERRRLTNA